MRIQFQLGEELSVGTKGGRERLGLVFALQIGRWRFRSVLERGVRPLVSSRAVLRLLADS